MRFRKPLMLVLAMGFSAGSVMAALSPSMQEWGKGPVQHLMTKQEAAQWKAIKTDEEAQKFIDLFWAKRDPSPGTPENEHKLRFDQLVQLSDERFQFQRTKGSMTDRGRVMILVGPPSSIANNRADTPSGTLQQAPQSIESREFAQPDVTPTQVWKWEKERVPAYMGGRDMEISFVDRHGNGDFRVDTGSKTNVPDTLAKAQQSYIVNPNLTQVPAQAVAQPQAAPAPPPAQTVVVPGVEATPAKVFKTESLKVAVDEFKTATTNPYKAPHITYGEFITPEGEYFVPVQIYVPGDSGLTKDTTATFFSVVEDAQGNVVGVWEEPATLSESKTDLYFDKSLNLQPGKYKAVFGLARDGKPVAVTKADLDLKGLAKDSAGASILMISNNIYALPAAQSPTDPFAFGGIKVVPKGDRAFAKADELWYFFELRNPGVDANGAPKVQVKVDVEGTTNAKKKVKMSAPLSEAVAEPLKGVAGHFGVGSSIPLSGFEPGEYTLKLKVIDTVTKQTYNMEQPFKVTK
jgi:GWxTD domain-containing protein